MRTLLLSLLVCVGSGSVYSQTAQVVVKEANLRGTPSVKGKIVDTLPYNSALEVFKKKGKWYLVQAVDYVGWINGNTIILFDAQVKTPVKKQPPRTSRKYIPGSRGGCYYINSRGNKTYVSRSLCK